MSNSLNQDEYHRSANIEESTAMTIEFLRARLLSERSVSRSARQRADELATRVMELEEQLKIVSLQRMRAEKATADVLAILESNGATDLSEEYDSSSDQEATPCDSEVGPSSFVEGENLAGGKSCRRSLSWKSDKGPSRSLETKYMDSSRRRHSSCISSANSSPKHVGRSCRRIKRRETSATEEVQIDTNGIPFEGSEVAEGSGVPTYSGVGPETSKECARNHKEQYLFEGPVVEALDNQSLSNGHYSSGIGGDKDMERALEQQAQLIEQFEAEEKAQTDWEERFRENISRTPDSFDVGNHSDVTEERDESREPAPPFHGEKFADRNQETNLKGVGLSTSYESLNDQKSTRSIALKAETEVAFPVSKNNYDQKQSVNHHYPSVNHYNDTPSNPKTEVVPSTTNSFNKEASGSTNQFALMPSDTSDKLGSVLEALQQAKLSLKQNLDRSPVVESGPLRIENPPPVPIMRNEDRFEFPVGSAGLFRLPTDFQREAMAQEHFLSSGSQLRLTNYSPEPVSNRSFPSPYVQSRLSSPAGPFTAGTSPYMEARSLLPPTFPVSQTTLDSGLATAGLPSASRYAYPDYPFYTDTMQRVPSAGRLSRPLGNREDGDYPFYADTMRRAPSADGLSRPRENREVGDYPFYADTMRRVPSADRLSRPLENREVGLRPTSHMQYPSSLQYYDDHTRPYMYR